MALCRRFLVSWASTESSDMGAGSFYIDSDRFRSIHLPQPCQRCFVCGRLAFEKRRYSARAIPEIILFWRSFLFIDKRFYLLCQQIRPWFFSRLTPRRSQRRSTPKISGLPLEFMDGLNYTTVIELAEPLARMSRRSFGAKTDRRASAFDR